MTEICIDDANTLKKSLDNLIIEYLDAVSDYEQSRHRANEFLRNGYIDLSRAKLSAGQRGIANYQETTAPLQLKDDDKIDEMTDTQKQAARRMFGVWPGPLIVSSQVSFSKALGELLVVRSKAKRADQLAETLSTKQKEVALALSKISSDPETKIK